MRRFFFRILLSALFPAITVLATTPAIQATFPTTNQSPVTLRVSSKSVAPVQLAIANSSTFVARSDEPVASLAPNAPRVQNPNFIRVPADVADLQSAISQIADGGIIELASGTYPSPSGGFKINDTGKGFTIRAAAGATVTLDGGSARDIIRFVNSTVTAGRPVVFQDLIFANGLSTTDGIAGGVTLQKAQATFINCKFYNNKGNQPTTGGGGTLVAISSIAFFFNCEWNGNTAKNYGAGLADETQGIVYIHTSRFINNRTNMPNHFALAAGGGIHVGDSTLRVTNTRFEGNEAGYVGGGIYAVGTWTSSTPTNVLVANSTFISNKAQRDPSVSFPYPVEAGAFHAEDNTIAKIYNSRFVTNSAHTGGAVTAYRSIVEIHGSVFQGNQATGTGAANGFGAAICALSNDTPLDGTNNRRSVNLTVTNTLIQGRYGSVGTVGQSGGGLYVAGDYNRTYGANGVSQIGTAADNRAIVALSNVVLTDLDVQELAGTPGTGIGGGLLVDLANLTMQNSLIINSDAIGSTNSAGGGIAILDQSIADIIGTTFARNTSGKYGGAVFVQGSMLNLTNSNLIENALTNIGQDASNSYGAAIFPAPDTSRNIPVTGTIQGCIISNNVGLPFFDDDRTNGPINDLRYNGNQIYSTYFAPSVYTNSIGGYCCRSVAQLNSLMIVRSNGTQTPKSQVANTWLSSAPVVGAILAAPPTILATNASGDPAPPTTAYLGYAWSGGSATLDGAPVTGNAGVASASVGMHTLSVNGNSFTANVSQGVTPAVTLTATSSDGSSYTLSWSDLVGAFLDATMDQGITITPAASGAVSVTPVGTRTYRLYIITQEGGVVAAVTPSQSQQYSVFLPMVIR